MAIAESTLLFTSVAIRYTVLAPTSLQVKLVTSKLKLGAPQASLVPLSTSEVVIVALPLASK